MSPASASSHSDSHSKKEKSSSSSSDDDAAEEEEEEEEEEPRATKAGLVNSGYLSENTASPLPLTTNIVRVRDNSDSFSREEKFVLEEVTSRPEDFFGIYAKADDDDGDELRAAGEQNAAFLVQEFA
ncbi:hypothetical protein TYRP_023469 [Tyrophagus putrescentiae]|nr:hypothetical protein TYRP_023469 [Tyrophagus putrescentiae]